MDAENVQSNSLNKIAIRICRCREDSEKERLSSTDESFAFTV